MLARIQTTFRSFRTFLGAHAVITFFVLMALLFGVIALAQKLRTPQAEPTQSGPDHKETALFTVGQDTPYAQATARVKKETLLRVTALAPGIVTAVNVTPGKSIRAGQSLLTLTNDYQSGAAAIQKEIAEINLEIAKEQEDVNKHITRVQKKIAKADPALTDREKRLALLSAKQSRLQSEGSADVSALQLDLANTNEALLHPKTFTSGTVQSIAVKRGDYVTPGQVLATILNAQGTTTLEALVSQQTALLFEPSKPSTLKLQNTSLTLTPTFFSRSETQNGLYSILFTLSQDIQSQITDGELLVLNLPLRTQTGALVPIDAVFQDAGGAWILTEEEGTAVSHAVVLGPVYGNFVEVGAGLPENGRVILNRSVVAGDAVMTQ